MSSYGLIKVGSAPENVSVADKEIADYVRAYLPDEQLDVQALRAQAEEEASRVTGRAILNQQFRMDLPAWPQVESMGKRICYSTTIELPRNPVVSVDSVKYYDEDGTLITVDASLFIGVSSYEPGLVFFKKAFTFPTLSERPDALQITFTAGHGTETITPETTGGAQVLRQAILLLSRHFYAGGNPNPTADKTSDYETAQILLMGQRVNGFIK